MPDPTPDPADLDLRLRQTEDLLTQARDALAASERKRRIDRELAAQGAIDLDTAATLAEAAAAGDNPDIPAIVADLKRTKPFLFSRQRPAASVMAGDPISDPPTTLDHAAAEARDTGDRRDLLRYLRLKRGA